MPTLKEVSADAEIPSHRLMLRAGFVRKLASGTYTYLPLGTRMLAKAMDILRREMNAAGAQEILMPIVQPMELWERTGRRDDYGATLGWFTDRHGRHNVLTPTAEEVVTALAAGEIRSYKQLPVTLYQIGVKFRDEFRPRFGVLRSREFLMKDAYSFHADAESLDATYRLMLQTYRRIFTRCGLPYVAVEAAAGPVGGSTSHEFMVPAETGEDVLFHTADGGYAANVEKAAVDPLPEPSRPSDAPARAEVHTPDVGSIDAVCAFLGARPEELIKTLVFQAPDRVVVALVRGDHEINTGKLAAAAGVETLELACPETIEELTGAAVGFAGPVGLAEKAHSMVIDHAVAAMVAGVTGANKTDYHVRNVVPGRDFPVRGPRVAPADIRNATAGDTHGGKPLLSRRGIEVGHVFKLGAKYSEALGARFLDEAGKDRPCLMGCYGIGVNRILAAAIEAGHDEAGCILPVTIAPFELEVLAVNADSGPVMQAAERLQTQLSDRGADVLLDDRPLRAGVKFKDADLIGIPLRLVVGEKRLAEGKVELKRRTDEKPRLIDLDQAPGEAMKVLDELRTACQP